MQAYLSSSEHFNPKVGQRELFSLDILLSLDRWDFFSCFSALMFFCFCWQCTDTYSEDSFQTSSSIPFHTSHFVHLIHERNWNSLTNDWRGEWMCDYSHWLCSKKKAKMQAQKAESRNAPNSLHSFLKCVHESPSLMEGFLWESSFNSEIPKVIHHFPKHAPYWNATWELLCRHAERQHISQATLNLCREG